SITVLKDSIISADNKSKKKFTLDAAKKPKHLDIMEFDGMVSARTIYELSGDTLKVAVRSDLTRPTSFDLTDKANGPTNFVEYQRVAKVSDDKKAERKPFVGIWKFTKARGDGEDAPAHILADLHLVFDKFGKVKVVGPREEDYGEYLVDPAKKH